MAPKNDGFPRSESPIPFGAILRFHVKLWKGLFNKKNGWNCSRFFLVRNSNAGSFFYSIGIHLKICRTLFKTTEIQEINAPNLDLFLLVIFYGLYHSKSPLNHHLG